MAPSPFQLVSGALRTNGYSVVPLHYRSDSETPKERGRRKSPALNDWDDYCERHADEKTYLKWMGQPNQGIGVCLGNASKLLALDFDDDINGLHDAIKSIVPDSPVKKVGKKGLTAFYQYSGEKTQSLKISKPGGSVTVLDILAGGRHTVLPPSPHPEGMAYRWLTERTLENTYSNELPAIDPAIMARVVKLFPSGNRVNHYHAPQPLHFDTTTEITEAISHIPPDVGYSDWIAIGMALQDRLGMEGYTIWDTWSASGTKYEGQRETYYKWCSFKSGGVTIATLFDMATKHGFVNKGYQQSYPSPVILSGGNMENPGYTIPDVIPDKTHIPDSMFYPRFDQTIVDAVLDAPGLPGMVCRYINETALYPLPVLSLGAALAFSGAVMANKVESPTGLRSNIYALGVAESGSGKDWPRQACKHLMNHFAMGKQAMGEPISGSGLLTSLINADGRGLILIDEFGLFMQAMAGKSASPHKKEIAKYLMELYTSAGQVFLGPEYANKDGLNPRVEIINPCLSMFPVTTPSTFYENISGKEVIDGFMARFLVFESDRYPIKVQQNRRARDDIPKELIESINYWKAKPALLTLPLTVEFTAEADDLFTDYSIKMRMKAAKGGENNLSSIYSRITENALRIALVSNEKGVVDGRIATWAIKTAEFCSSMLSTAVRDTIGDNDYERTFKRMLKVIGQLQDEVKYPLGVPHSVLIGRTRFMDTKMRNEMLQAAMDSSDLHGQQDPAREPGAKGTNPLYYKLRKDKT